MDRIEALLENVPTPEEVLKFTTLGMKNEIFEHQTFEPSNEEEALKLLLSVKEGPGVKMGKLKIMRSLNGEMRYRVTLTHPEEGIACDP